MARAYVIQRVDGQRQIVVEQCGVMASPDDPSGERAAQTLAHDINLAIARLHDSTPIERSIPRSVVS